MYKSYKVLAVGVFRCLYAVQLLETIQPHVWRYFWGSECSFWN